MSVNHQFIEFSDKVVKRYAKTVPFIITGNRINPYNPADKLNFLLQTEETCFDFDTKQMTGIDYEHDVIELYSDTEAKLFLRMNKSVIERGYLKEYDGSPNETSTENLISDAEIKELASIKAPNSLKSRLKTISSAVVIKRCIDQAIKLDRSYTIIKILENKLEELQSQ